MRDLMIKKALLISQEGFQSSARRGSNPRSSPWQGDVVPLYYSRNMRLSVLPDKSVFLDDVSQSLHRARDGDRTRDLRLGKAT